MSAEHDISENDNQNLFQYHDNVVNLPVSSLGGYELIEGTFTVEEFSISSGQDPQHKNRVGDVRRWHDPHYGTMTFVAGRHGTSEVATWWTQRIGNFQNTFNHNPGALNFAFIGTMILKFTGGILGASTGVYTLKDVAFAQGHTGSANNWWFGSTTGQNTGPGHVRIPGKGNSGEIVGFHFRRGDINIDGVNTVRLIQIGDF